MAKEKIKVYTYTRVSTAMQIDGYSLDAQKSRMKAFAEFNDYEPKISGFGAVDDVGKRPISLWHKQTPGILGVDFYPDRLYNIL